MNDQYESSYADDNQMQASVDLNDQKSIRIEEERETNKVNGSREICIEGLDIEESVFERKEDYLRKKSLEVSSAKSESSIRSEKTQSSFLRKASLRLNQAKTKMSSIKMSNIKMPKIKMSKIKPINFSSIEMQICCFYTAAIVGGLLLLSLIIGLVFLTYEVLQAAFSWFGAVLILAILFFFLCRMMIVLAAFPTSFWLVEKILETQSCSEIAVQMCQNLSMLLTEIKSIEPEKDVDVCKLSSLSK